MAAILTESEIFTIVFGSALYEGVLTDADIEVTQIRRLADIDLTGVISDNVKKALAYYVCYDFFNKLKIRFEERGVFQLNAEQGQRTSVDDDILIKNEFIQAANYYLSQEYDDEAIIESLTNSCYYDTETINMTYRI
ncbi:MAG: hypothetical protein EOL98_12075 [Negativicutes bacterium]|nr:hypothetical protein [Negativicutes bacterium]